MPATLVDAEVSASNLDAAIARVTAELGPPTSAAGAPSAAGKRTLLQQQVRFIILFQYVVSLNPLLKLMLLIIDYYWNAFSSDGAGMDVIRAGAELAGGSSHGRRRLTLAVDLVRSPAVAVALREVRNARLERLHVEARTVRLTSKQRHSRRRVF